MSIRSGLIFFIFANLIFLGCVKTPEIIQKDYKYEKKYFDTLNIEYEFTMQNFEGSGKVSELIKKLIYKEKTFDEYVEYAEEEFTKTLRKDDYPLLINEDGTEYFYHSTLTENYKIGYYNVDYVIVEYFQYVYYTGAAHGLYWLNCFILDIAEEKILTIDEILNPIPDDLLKNIISAEYDFFYDYLRDNIWPPDTINFKDGNLELIWNIYSITPYSYGTISINIDHELANSYLTEKGRKIWN